MIQKNQVFLEKSWNTKRRKKIFLNAFQICFHVLHTFVILFQRRLSKRLKKEEISIPHVSSKPRCDRFENARVKHAWENEALITFHQHRGNLYAL